MHSRYRIAREQYAMVPGRPKKRQKGKKWSCRGPRMSSGLVQRRAKPAGQGLQPLASQAGEPGKRRYLVPILGPSWWAISDVLDFWCEARSARSVVAVSSISVCELLRLWGCFIVVFVAGWFEVSCSSPTWLGCPWLHHVPKDFVSPGPNSHPVLVWLQWLMDGLRPVAWRMPVGQTTALLKVLHSAVLHCIQNI